MNRKGLPQTPVDVVDYLDEDQAINGQRYMCVSMITPTANMCKEACTSISKKQRIGSKIVNRIVDAWEDMIKMRRGFKIRGVYDTIDQARERSKEISKFDPNHHVFISEVGKWACFGQNPETVEEQKYMHDELNTIMEAHEKERIKASKDFNERRRAMLEREVEKQLEEESSKPSEIVTLDAKRYAIQYKIDQKFKEMQKLQSELADAQEAFTIALEDNPEYKENPEFASPEKNPMISISSETLANK